MAMTREQIIEWAKRHGFSEDKYGHLQKHWTDANGKLREMRIKLQATSVRTEVRVHFEPTQYGKTPDEWMKVGGGYMKDARLPADDRITFKREVKAGDSA